MYQYGWFSPNGENVNFGILSKLTFHSLMKEKPLGNKVNKCRIAWYAPRARLCQLLDFTLLQWPPVSTRGFYPCKVLISAPYKLLLHFPPGWRGLARHRATSVEKIYPFVPLCSKADTPICRFESFWIFGVVNLRVVDISHVCKWSEAPSRGRDGCSTAPPIKWASVNTLSLEIFDHFKFCKIANLDRPE